MITEPNSTELMPFIIAVDFDGTLVSDCFPEIGGIIAPTWDRIKRAQEAGAKIILWTCRDGAYLAEAVEFCHMNGLYFDAVNENLPEVLAVYQGNPKKVFADIYVDDHMGLPVSAEQSLYEYLCVDKELLHGTRE